MRRPARVPSHHFLFVISFYLLYFLPNLFQSSFDRCDHSSLSLDENCTTRTHHGKGYPECCEVEITCIKVVTNLVPVVYTAANLSEIERENEILSVRSTPAGEDLADESSARGKRETRGLNTTECKNGTLTMRVGDRIPEKRCAQRECVLDVDGQPRFKILRCDTSSIAVSDNCEVLPPASIEFPKCCVVVFKCSKTVTKVTADPYEDLNALGGPPDLGNNHVHPISRSLTLDHQDQDVTFKSDLDLNVNRRKRETAAGQLSPEGCVINNRKFDIGDHIPAEGCGQTRCVNDTNGPRFVTISCNLQQNETEDGCYVMPLAPASRDFPKCCLRVFACEKLVTQVVPNEEALVEPTKPLNNEVDANLNEEDSEIHHSYHVVKDSKELLRHARRKRDATLKEEAQEKLEGCKVDTNRTLKKEETLPLEGCGHVTCTTGKDGRMVLVAESCNQTASDIPEGCTVVSKPEQQYPECCVMELICTKVVTAVIPTVVDSPRTNELQRSKRKKEKILHQNLLPSKAVPNPAMETSESKLEKETFAKRNSTSRGTVKFAVPAQSKERLSKYNYKEFIARSRPQIRQRGNSSVLSPPKPTFVLPARRRRRNRVKAKDAELPVDQIALELNDNARITVASKTKPGSDNLTKEEKDSVNKISRRGRAKNRRRLSQMLSARNLRRNASSVLDFEIQKEKKEPQADDKRSGTKLDKEERKTNEISPRSKTGRSRSRSRSNVNTTRLAQRRRIHANRLNRVRTTSKPDVKKKELTTVKEEINPIKSNKEKVNVDETKEKKPKLIRKNFMIQKRRNEKKRKKGYDEVSPKIKEDSKLSSTQNETKVAAEMTTEAPKEEEKESLKLTAQAKINRNKKVQISNKVRNNKPKPQIIKRRRKITTTEEKMEEVTTLAPSTKAPRKKASYKLAASNVTKVLSRTRARTPAPKETRRRVSQSKILRERLKKEKNLQEITANDARTPPKPEPIQILSQPTPSPKEGTYISTISSPYTSSYYTESPYLLGFENELKDIEKFYEFPLETDLEISSSDTDSTHSPDIEDNEIPEVVPEAPIKVTTLTFTTSRRSFKSSKTRNTSKNFHETPTVYGAEETYKAVTYR